MNQNNDTFNYSYSANQHDEIQKILEKYVPKEESKLERLRRLDASTVKTGTIIAVTEGVISALVMGVGMCCAMVWGESLFIPGIIIGLIGIAGMVFAYPLYSRITKKQREKLAPEILKLADELSGK